MSGCAPAIADDAWQMTTQTSLGHHNRPLKLSNKDPALLLVQEAVLLQCGGQAEILPPNRKFGPVGVLHQLSVHPTGENVAFKYITVAPNSVLPVCSAIPGIFDDQVGQAK
eukprot:CAMPEP_0204406140 /NCGR_PEP_ID=MMETSP0470-20130426/7857_1 /ASSEMBLY_ACC=CAM_ASM_000385 /TAXON_ID=2969 /ORGANISM="Oxyrrhis marina" /LENGTH=110 /DNA_ID=CAMNT_0051401665 /DNA_START=373 /DNA_END=706 /DNA_ORIENTATION=-